MPLFSKLNASHSVRSVNESDHEKVEPEKAAAHADTTPVDSDEDVINDNAQQGVQKAEATTQAWSKSHLIAAYILIWIIYFVSTMQQGMTGQLTPYVTSEFQYHSLTAATSIMSNIIGGLFQLPLAKILDIWGRPHGFALMVFLLTIGLIMMAACNNVKTYAAAQVFYWVGYNGMNYTMGIFVADTSSLKNRGFTLAYISSPYIITTWLGGPLAEAVLAGPGFRWGFGVWAIVEPVITLPLFALFMWNYRKAKRAGLIAPSTSGRTTLQSIKHYFLEFDIAGVILLCGGLALFLLPFSLYSYQPDGWQSPMIICMIVFGGLLLIAFVCYERFLAPVTFIPYTLLADRTVLGANLLAAVLFVEFYLWDNYFSSFLQVVNGLSITEASYVAQIYSVGSCFWSLVVGVAIRATGRFKWIALYFGVPLTILGVGLMIHFRQPDTNIGYIVMCQIFIALSGGALVITEQIAAMAATSHQWVATVIAIEGCFSQVGGAIGSTVAGAIWTGVFPRVLQERLPPAVLDDFASIYGELPTQLSYPKGSPARTAIDGAYGEAQKYMLISATAVLSLAIVFVVMWRDINVKNFKQVKGMVW